MQKIYSLLTIALLTIGIFSCSKDNSEPTPEPTPTPTTPTTPAAEKRATAVVTVTATGIALNEVQVVLSETSFTPVNGVTNLVNPQEKDLTADGKASFDVKNYIGKKLYFAVCVKTTQEVISSEVERTITEGDNAIAISAVKKEVGAKITVYRDGKAAANEEVYALGSAEVNSFNAILAMSMGYKESVKDNFETKLTTDSNGVVTFNNLPISGKYKFVVFGKSSYQSVDVDVDKNSLKEATINITTEQPVKVTIIKSGNKIADQQVYAILESYFGTMKDKSEDEIARIIEGGSLNEYIGTATRLSIFSTSATTDAQGVATFDNLEKDKKYLFVAATGGLTPKYRGFGLTVDRTAQNRTIDLTAPIRVTFNVTDTRNILLDNVSIVINNITQKTEDGYAYFDLAPNATYFYRATTPCGAVKTGSFSVQNDSKWVFLDTFTPETGSIILRNTSSNPYTVTIGSRQWVVNGKSSHTLTGDITTYTVRWKQNSGYLIYATEGSKNIELTCSQREITVSFPE